MNGISAGGWGVRINNIDGGSNNLTLRVGHISLTIETLTNQGLIAAETTRSFMMTQAERQRPVIDNSREENARY